MNTTKKETFIKRFLKLESSGGIVLMIAAVIALVLANTGLENYYALLIDTPVEIRIGEFEIAKPLLLWINGGLMAVFFFLIGLELKREHIEGELSNKRNIILPGVGAIGGMLIPALIYTYFNAGNAVAMKGWAIPAATDIAFALGILSLLGSRVPTSIKNFSLHPWQFLMILGRSSSLLSFIRNKFPYQRSSLLRVASRSYSY